ncbi:uncharacterized protein LOC116665393 [Camelus ferus]|uniref:Uncharacterized protein LOC116665393 n=1 Tax=Camelus ferus TaxID=419612 RepID=A0A8B8TEW7_CAMFR|nr:uncharacterized protein LOC116665393 [Camelus ferus]
MGLGQGPPGSGGSREARAAGVCVREPQRPPPLPVCGRTGLFLAAPPRTEVTRRSARRGREGGEAEGGRKRERLSQRRHRIPQRVPGREAEPEKPVWSRRAERVVRRAGRRGREATGRAGPGPAAAAPGGKIVAELPARSDRGTPRRAGLYLSDDRSLLEDKRNYRIISIDDFVRGIAACPRWGIQIGVGSGAGNICGFSCGLCWDLGRADASCLRASLPPKGRERQHTQRGESRSGGRGNPRRVGAGALGFLPDPATPGGHRGSLEPLPCRCGLVCTLGGGPRRPWRPKPTPGAPPPGGLPAGPGPRAAPPGRPSGRAERSRVPRRRGPERPSLPPPRLRRRPAPGGVNKRRARFDLARPGFLAGVPHEQVFYRQLRNVLRLKFQISRKGTKCQDISSTPFPFH